MEQHTDGFWGLFVSQGVPAKRDRGRRLRASPALWQKRDAVNNRDYYRVLTICCGDAGCQGGFPARWDAAGRAGARDLPSRLSHRSPAFSP